MTDEGHEILIDDMTLQLLSTGTYLVWLGAPTRIVNGSGIEPGIVLGFLALIGAWWGAFLVHPAYDQEGRVLGDESPPTIAGWADERADAARMLKSPDPDQVSGFIVGTL